jgi:uncharacterized protein YndB with AHSA1/START domain
MSASTKTIQIAPVNKVIMVKASQAKSFDVFTNGIDRWWPKTHGIGNAPVVSNVIEPHKGGRWYSTHEDGSEAVIGHMRVWEPPARIVFGWEINAMWKPDATVGSEVEVRFVAVDANTTRVEVEHRDFESLGQEGGKQMRDQLDGGWPGILELYKQAVEG